VRSIKPAKRKGIGYSAPSLTGTQKRDFYQKGKGFSKMQLEKKQINAVKDWEGKAEWATRGQPGCGPKTKIDIYLGEETNTVRDDYC